MPEDDAWGAALLDYLDGASGPELILERDDGWQRPALPPSKVFAEPDEWDAAEREILGRVSAGPVLDLGPAAPSK
jgi:hypothetical protein